MNRLLTAAVKLAAILALAAVAAACSDFARGFREGLAEPADGPPEVVRAIEKHNQTGYDLIEEGKYDEGIGWLWEAVKFVYEVHPEYETLEDEVRSKELFDSPFNNMSWAYNELGDYEESLYWIDRALLLLPNTEIEYINKGNALYGLNRYDEAVDYYDLALEENEDSLNALYGKGLIYYDKGYYSGAADMFNRCLSIDSSDYDAAEMLLYSFLGREQEEDALAFAEKWLGDYPDRFDAYRLKSIALEHAGEFEEAEAFALQAAEAFPGLTEAQELPGRLYYDSGYYGEAVAYFKSRLASHPSESGSAVWLIRSYAAMQDYAAAEEAYHQAARSNPDHAELAEAMGDMYLDQTQYAEAAHYYGLAAEWEPYNEIYATAALEALYYGNRIDRCAASGASMRNKMSYSGNIAWYTGLCQLEKGDYESAVISFEEAVAINPDDYASLAQLAYAHLLTGNDEEAAEFASASLELYDSEATALYVEQELKERKRPLSKRVEAFFRDQYLYQETSSEWEKAFASLTEAASPQEIAEAVERAKKQDDPFTFVIYGEEYDQLSSLSGGESVTFREEGDLLYLSVSTFDATTDNRFIEILDSVKNPERKTLVLDLRGNAGGLSDSANRMLDALLPDYVTSTMIYRDGSTESYYSDSSSLAFKKIYVLVDEGTASAAELVTLGLKTYLPNVTIIGRDTYGKGVGQVVFEDRSAKMMVFVVNFYWNVKQTNIASTRIQPDIYVTGSSIDSFMKPVREGR
ncbi:tetratricopeptide repeat protein [Paenibacillus nanensis]|uniref:Tetratricopeptide repeat protein n=1 Tax=Paenibacillus nanensis TaxID=393251 RepID=A0A3A1USJ9_9BACL|nr:S41 family peptidase [Paenibacillus nanensis]RIX51467.1 tetratricopeptide repeat protein [Paenibacillus nanensis]